MSTSEMNMVLSDIKHERLRQMEEEGWTPEHDDRHTDGSLAAAAAFYAAGTSKEGAAHRTWPRTWNRSWYKPTNKRRDLVKAAALIVAEIERLDRLEGQS